MLTMEYMVPATNYCIVRLVQTFTLTTRQSTHPRFARMFMLSHGTSMSHSSQEALVSIGINLKSTITNEIQGSEMEYYQILQSYAGQIFSSLSGPQEWYYYSTISMQLH